MKRFTKAKLIEDLIGISIKLKEKYGFNPNGLSQLWPRNATDKEKKLIRKAYEYGRYDAFETISREVEYGNFGVKND